MGGDSEGLRRTIAESSTASDEAADDDQTYTVREGVARAIDAEDVLAYGEERVADDAPTREPTEFSRFADEPELAAPPRFDEIVDMSAVAPDGSSLDRGGLTLPTGEAIGTTSAVDELGLEGGLGGSRIDPLGMLGGGGQTAGRTGGPGSGLQGKDGSAVSSGGGPGSDEHFNTVNEVRGGSGLPDLTRDEYNAAFGVGGSGGAGGAEDSGGGGDSRGILDSVGGFGISDAAWRAADEFHTENATNWVREYGAAEVFPADDDDKSAADEIQAGLQASYGGSGSDDDVDDDEKPDPNAGYDVVTAENIDEALRVQGIAPYAQPTQDDDSSGAVTGVNLDWAAPGSDPRLTQYGPDGPPAVGADASAVAPQTDGIFDPPPETAAVGMAGAEASMADPGAALGGADAIGSSTPEEAPPPPDPPPGGDTGDDPWAPPPGEGQG